MLTLLIASGCGGKKEYLRSTPEEFGKTLIEVLKTHDEVGLKTLIPGPADMKATIMDSNASQEEKDRFDAEFDEFWAEMQEEIQRNIFDKFAQMTPGKSTNGLDPAKFEYQSTVAGNERFLMTEGSRFPSAIKSTFSTLLAFLAWPDSTA